jgi:hypothetical protein
MMFSAKTLAAVSGFAVAELTIDGLAICCFNRGGKYWEVAYLRLAKPKHELVINIQEVSVLGELVGQPIRHPIPEGVLGIGVKLTAGSDQHYATYPNGGPSDPNFDRNALNAPNDYPHDLNWMIDLAGPEPKHGKFKKLKSKGGGRVPVTLAQIQHSLFMVRRPGGDAVKLSPRGKGPNGPGSFRLGQINEEIVGVLLATAPGDIEFSFTPVGSYTINPLPYSGTRLYRIAITNMDVQTKFLPVEKRETKDGYVKGDFHLFYEVLETDDKTKEQELWAIPRGPRSVDGDCNPAGASISTLDDLIK